MACLFKFLSTMETLETEQLRKRHALREYQNWRLTFEDATGRRGYSGWDANAMPLKWEVINFRGVDMNTADVRVIAFGTRELSFGEGPVVQSPADVAKIVGVPMPTEDDVLHSDQLPTFGDTLSREEAELLVSYLTVDYMRIPLVVGFFASRDRVTYLFNVQLRDLLRAVLFEPGPFVPTVAQDAVKEVPVRRTALQQKQHELDRFMLANIPEDVRVLGTPHGLLLNELHCSPSATLDPILFMLKSLDDLKDCSLRSADASFVLYLTLLAIDVDVYILYAFEETQRGLVQSHSLSTLSEYHRKFQEVFHGICFAILSSWLKEAEDSHDIESSCVIHAYMALLWSGLRPNELTPKTIESLLANIAFVRHWHGFGMGQNRSDILWDATDGPSDPEARLLRFLQAQGIDTTKISKGALEQYLKNTNRPLFLHVGRDTIRYILVVVSQSC